MFSEKDMEDQIAANPERFLGERDLTVVARQFSIGGYIFDLLFQDRHGGKLIVEIQKGTLDRVHTYKILDYYDEYRERNPREFIDVMVVANRITNERKKRLEAMGVAFIELPEAWFLSTSVSTSTAEPIPLAVHSVQGTSDNTIPSGSNVAQNNSADRHYFRSSGPSAFVNAVRSAIQRTQEAQQRWRIEGVDSISAKLSPVTAIIRSKCGKEGSSLRAQLFLERPKPDGGIRCIFQIYSESKQTDTKLRESIALSMRRHLRRHEIPGDYRLSTGSTVVRISGMTAPRLVDADHDTPENVEACREKIDRIVEFFKWIDSALSDWQLITD